MNEKLRYPLMLLMVLHVVIGIMTGCQSPPPGQNLGTEVKQARPNIFLLTLEDLSPRIGAYGDGVAQTPNIDQFAKEGILFRNVYTTAGVCAPSRSSLITGVHQQSLGTMHMRTSSFRGASGEKRPYEAVIPGAIKAFPELLRKVGYTTINDDKMDYQFGEPFTVWNESQTGAAWRENTHDGPLFMMVNFFTTHEGYTWLPNDDFSHPLADKTRKRNSEFDKTKLVHTDPSIVVIPPYYPQTSAVAGNIARHYDNLAATDRYVGEFLSFLQDQGMLDSSIIILTSDHGDGLPRAKRSLYDSGIAVPFMVRLPGAALAGTEREDLVSFVDLAPTILALANVERPDWMQGRVIIGDKAQPAPEFIFASADRVDQSSGRIKAVRSRNFKYIRNFLPQYPRLPYVSYQDVNPVMQIWRQHFSEGRLDVVQAKYFETPSPLEELYDMRTDPYEIQNLAADPEHQATLQVLRDAMDTWIEKVGDKSEEKEADMLATMWPGGQQPRTLPVSACLLLDGRIKLESETPGASIGYSGQTYRQWHVYHEPLLASSIVAKAIRYGFLESSEHEFAVTDLSVCLDLTQ